MKRPKHCPLSEGGIQMKYAPPVFSPIFPSQTPVQQYSMINYPCLKLGRYGVFIRLAPRPEVDIFTPFSLFFLREEMLIPLCRLIG